MKEPKKQDGRAGAKRIASLVEQAIDDGAKTVEEIHRAIASKPLDVLERLDVFKETVKDVRKVQETSIGAIYELIHKVNREVGKLAQELLKRPAPGRPPRGRRRSRGVRAPTRPEPPGLPAFGSPRYPAGHGHALRDHRRRDVGHPQRDQARGGGLRRRHPLREGRPPGRHLAREHLPGHRLRRPLPPLQLLLRAEPGLEPPLLAGRRDPGLLRGRGPQARCRARIRFGDEIVALRVHRRALAARDDERPPRRGRRRDRRDGRAPPSEHAGHRRARRLRGRAASTARAGTTPSPLDGRRVGVVGTGSTAVQIVSALVDRVASSRCSSAPRSG